MQTSLYLIAVALCIFSTGLTTRKAGRGAPLTFFTVYLVIQSAAFVFELAMNGGFNSKSAFHSAFRRCTGVTPGDFRVLAGQEGRQREDTDRN